MFQENKPHKHAEIIKAWADGAIIQFYNKEKTSWEDVQWNKPEWDIDTEYRVKPELLLWYKQIPPQGIICYVWDNETVEQIKQVTIIKSYDEKQYYKFMGINSNEDCWQNAEPLTEKELLSFIEALKNYFLLLKL
jgi:hypothetical protein